MLTSAEAATVVVQVSDITGVPAQNAVVYAEALSGALPAKASAPIEIEQRSRQFQPFVTVVQVGTAITFPNHDSVRHHVYSFSPAKVFELKLFSGTGGTAVVFDKPGTVVIGCNIHDQMAAFIQVVDTSYFGKTDAAGKVTIDNIPSGKYRLKVWHPNLPATTAIPEKALSIGNAEVNVPILLSFKTEKK